MDLLAKVIHKITYDRLAYEPIREDFLSWYLQAYHDLSLEEKIDADNGELMEMALEARTEATSYEPETALNSAIQVTSSAESIVKLATAFLTLFGGVVGGILVGIGFLDLFPTVISIVSGIVGSGFLLIPGSAYPAYVILKHTVQTNGELIRLYNEELVISIGRIRENERRHGKLVSFYVHHSSLCSTTQLPVIVILGVIRAVSPRIYGKICSRLKSNTFEYYEDNFLKVLGKEYARIRNQKKEGPIL